ncbi:MAG: hypothetical protein AAGB11_05340 [Pseudomonadota bacterium]
MKRSWAGILFVAAAALVVNGCVYQKAVPIGGGAWRMETDGYGVVGSEIVRTQTLQDAAALTLKQGFTHFLLTDDPGGRSDIGVGAILYGSATVVAIGNPVVRRGPDTGVRTTVTVVMLRKDDPRIPKAYDALAVLAGEG